jgi:hypothetical protein
MSCCFKYVVYVNALFTNKMKNILIIIGIRSVVFLEPDKRAQEFECPVAVCSLISKFASLHIIKTVYLTPSKASGKSN